MVGVAGAAGVTGGRERAGSDAAEPNFGSTLAMVEGAAGDVTVGAGAGAGAVDGAGREVSEDTVGATVAGRGVTGGMGTVGPAGVAVGWYAGAAGETGATTRGAGRAAAGAAIGAETGACTGCAGAAAGVWCSA